jgi:hypothetical protein
MSPTHDPQQASLFDEPPPETPNEAATSRPEARPANAVLKVLAGGPATAQELSPAQRRMKRLMGRIDKLEQRIARVDEWRDKFHGPHAAAMDELRQTHDDLHRRITLQLHANMQSLKLSATQQAVVKDVLTQMIHDAGYLDDAELGPLLAPYVEDDEEIEWAEDEAKSLQRLKAMLAERMSPDELDALPDDHDVLMDLFIKTLTQQGASDRAEGPTPEPARAKGRASARQQKAEQAQTDAQATLRQVFRQLASALHPDRASDPADRARKTALMSEVNAAYKRQDLAALMQLQVQTAALDAQTLSRMSEERLANMNTLLKQQVARLEAQLRDSQSRIEAVLGVRLGPQTSERQVAFQLAQQRAELHGHLDNMREDLARMQRAAPFKRWIKSQIRWREEEAMLDAFFNDFY